MSARPDIAALPEPILKAFEGRPSLPLVELSATLGMDQKTLRRHVKEGNISCLVKGFGKSRPRREFTLSDVAGFYAKISRLACPSTDLKTRRITTSTSNSKVIAFSARPRRPTADAPRR